MRRGIILSTAVMAMLGACTLSAQQPNSHSTVHTANTIAGPKKVEMKEAQPGLMRLATANIDEAATTALRSTKGTLVSELLEKRGDQLVYVFSIRQDRTVHHVMVDARTGKLVPAQAKRVTHRHNSNTRSRKDK